MATGPFLSGSNDIGNQACALRASGELRCWGRNEAGQVGAGGAGDQPRPVVVNSFTANVDPSGTLEKNSRIATVTALINCEAGGEAHLTLNLTQGDISGTGRSVVKCADLFLHEPMTVPAGGPQGFQPGPAVATVEALVMDDGGIVQDQHWPKSVVLTAP
jgi:hypothetical protein